MAKESEEQQMRALWKEACTIASETLTKLQGRSYTLAEFYIAALATSILVTHPSIKTRDDAQQGLIELMQATMKVLDKHYQEESTDEKLVKEQLFQKLAALYDVQDQKPN